MLLIINADDLGTSEAINNEIFALMQGGLVTSATIIANAPAFEHAVARVTQFPQCSFGVHLNLTVFPPLTPARGLQPLLDGQGQLSRQRFQTALSAEVRMAALQELSAQVRRALDAGVPVSHFDSHHNIHTEPKLFLVLKALQRRFGIRKVRSTINFLPGGQRMARLRALKKQAFSLALRHVYATASPDGLGNFHDFHGALMAGRCPRFRQLELVTHPGTTNPEYRQEIALLQSGWQRVLPPNVELGSYHSI